MIEEALAEQGVTRLPTPKRGARPLAHNHIELILQNRYYVGVVKFAGAEYSGRHVPLISEELFGRCQRIWRQRVQSQEKGR